MMRRPGILATLSAMLIGSAVLRLGGDIPFTAIAQTEELPAQTCDETTLVTAMRERDAELDAREAALSTRDNALAKAESALATEQEALAAEKAEVAARLADVRSGAEDDVARLTAVYEAMKPKDAAALFSTMDPAFASGFIARMAPEAAASVMAGLDPTVAYAISAILAGRNVADSAIREPAVNP